MSNKTAKDVNVLKSWGCGQGDVFEKVPTKIAYPVDNPKLKQPVWGYGIKHSQIPVQWFKLLLDERNSSDEYDDTLLRQCIGDGTNELLRLPEGKTAKEVTIDYLKLVREHIFEIFEKENGSKTFQELPMSVYFTHPATWSHGARSATQEAALEAGFAARKGDTFTLIPEPEAAAVAAMKDSVAKLDTDSPFQVWMEACYRRFD